MVVENWRPDIRVELVKGASAKRWAQWMTVFALSGLILLAILFTGMALSGSGYGESPFLVAVVGLLVVDAISALVAFLGTLRVERRERLRGYTSTREHLELLEVDISTGYAMRMPGEKPLSREERNRRVETIERVRDTPA